MVTFPDWVQKNWPVKLDRKVGDFGGDPNADPEVGNYTVYPAILYDEFDNKFYLRTPNEWVNVGGGTVSSIYVTDVVPQNNLETVNTSTYDDGATLVSSFETTTNLVRVFIEFDGGLEYRGDYVANGVPFEGYTRISGDRRFSAFADIDLTGETEISIEGNEGSVDIPFSSIAPATITSIQFEESSYPGSQTELKENDFINLTVVADKEFDRIEVQDFGALKAQNVNVDSTTSTTVSLQIANRGTSPQELKGRLRVRTSSSSAYSNYIDTENTVTLNNRYPQISFSSVSYPPDQSALKQEESADLPYSISDSTSYSVTSDELDISDSGSVLTLKLNQNGRDRGYRNSGNNVTIVADRSMNGASSSSSTLVRIAHDSPDWLGSPPNPRLRSSEGGSDRSFSLDFNQSLQNLTLEGAIPEGFFSDISGNGAFWDMTLTISDSDPHTSSPYPFQVRSTNLANISTVHDASYRIQGFEPKSYTINTNDTLILNLGITVVNPDNLVISSSKPYPPFTYIRKSSFDPGLDNPHLQFVFTSPSQVEFYTTIIDFLAGTFGSLEVSVEERL